MRNEPELIEAVKNYQTAGNKKDLEYITESLTGFITSQAVKFSQNHETRRDLIQEGLMGVITAVKRCKVEDIKHNVSTYLCTCGRGKMLEYIRSTTDIFDLGKKGADFLKIHKMIRNHGDLDISHKEIEYMCAESNVPLYKFITTLNVMKMCNVDDDYSQHRSLSTTEEEVITLDTLERVNNYLKTLGLFKYESFVGRYSDEYTIKELALKHKKGKEWVRLAGDSVRKKLNEMFA